MIPKFATTEEKHITSIIAEKLEILHHLKLEGFFADLQSRTIAVARLQAINQELNRHYIRKKGL